MIGAMIVTARPSRLSRRALAIAAALAAGLALLMPSGAVHAGSATAALATADANA
jgi:hypothetical protein